jgi:flagellar basal body rod protein FlgC
MFRQSDEVARRPHASYLNRPTPELQVQGRYGQFDSRTSTNVAQESARNQAGPQPTPIPAAHDTFYDPSHPQADWGGLVSKVNNQKSHTYDDHRAQNQGIENTEDGMVSKEERQEFAHRRRANDELVTTAKQTYQMSSVINPGFDRWQTTHASFEAQEATSRDQMTYQRRAGTRRVVRDPSQSQGKEYYDPYDTSQV